MNKRLLSLLFVAIAATIVNSANGRVFKKRNPFLIFTKRSFSTKRPSLKVVKKDYNTVYSLFDKKHLTKTHRSINFGRSFLDCSLYNFINKAVEKNSNEYQKMMGEFFYTNKAKDIEPIKNNRGYTFSPRDAFGE